MQTLNGSRAVPSESSTSATLSDPEQERVALPQHHIDIDAVLIPLQIFTSAAMVLFGILCTFSQFYILVGSGLHPSLTMAWQDSGQFLRSKSGPGYWCLMVMLELMTASLIVWIPAWYISKHWSKLCHGDVFRYVTQPDICFGESQQFLRPKISLTKILLGFLGIVLLSAMGSLIWDFLLLSM
jgi:hypothetical protein